MKHQDQEPDKDYVSGKRVEETPTLRGQFDLDWAAKSIPALKKRLAEHRAKQQAK
ncbi:MAG: hypothetical protein AAEJ65_00820 [Planctomycetota bacterium]